MNRSPLLGTACIRTRVPSPKNVCFFELVYDLLIISFHLFILIELLRRVSSRKLYYRVKFIFPPSSYLNMDIL
jgi:hypothetical protein